MTRRIVLSSDQDEPSGSTEDLTIDYADDLNEQQYEAATAGDGPLLIIAGAGTGKTRTLIYRLAYLVETGTRPQQI
ncbi:MAG: UvrD-helicase domain-containing protein, partial [Salinibacter sp.]